MNTIGTTRLHLMLAVLALLTGTSTGLTVAAIVLLVLGLRTITRQRLAQGRSVAVGRGGFAPTEHPDLFQVTSPRAPASG
ncbi:hypothetical protein LRP67_15645 [Nocardioides sp. cx-169]|uniref:hypothetical protein n=1 Tax=Nocardioides sp. cx-169 TaxID=2899080 RepID=UPI001E6381FF|nr:hypothetical protein [Nocardioides sp. cx-169]MCD4535524.1 hypothetical protein [Nocardioides sp. cx-169]